MWKSDCYKIRLSQLIHSHGDSLGNNSYKPLYTVLNLVNTSLDFWLLVHFQILFDPLIKYGAILCFISNQIQVLLKGTCSPKICNNNNYMI